MTETATVQMPKMDQGAEMIYTQIKNVIDEIKSYNDVALADEKGTPVREIDKILKAEAKKVEDGENSDLSKEILKAYADAQKAYDTYKKKVEVARNTYRTEVLGEEEQTSSTDEFDVDSLKEKQKVAKQGLEFLILHAKMNGNAELASFAESIEVPNVGRQGSSTVGGPGTRRPRVFVTVDGVQYDNFTKAAAAITSKENKIVAGDLTNAWVEAGEPEGNFSFTKNGTSWTLFIKSKDGNASSETSEPDAA